MPGGGPSSDPIDIDYSAQTIEDFLNVTTAMAGTATLTSLDFNRVVDLVKITEQFGCDHWHARAIDSLFTADKAKSVAIFDFAVARADWDLGRRAIENFNNSVPRDGQSRTFCEWLETKPLEWQVALYRAIVEGLNVFGCVRSFDMWSTAARSFQRPVDPQKAKYVARFTASALTDPTGFSRPSPCSRNRVGSKSMGR